MPSIFPSIHPSVHPSVLRQLCLVVSPLPPVCSASPPSTAAFHLFLVTWCPAAAVSPPITCSSPPPLPLSHHLSIHLSVRPLLQLPDKLPSVLVAPLCSCCLVTSCSHSPPPSTPRLPPPPPQVLVHLRAAPSAQCTFSLLFLSTCTTHLSVLVQGGKSEGKRSEHFIGSW